MKQLILLAGFTLTLLHASAQIQPKSIFVNSSLGVQISSDQTSKSRSYQISPSVNYALNQRWAIGISLYYNKLNTESGTTTEVVNPSTGYYLGTYKSERKYYNMILGPQVRYYYPISDKLSIFNEARAGLALSSTEINNYSSSYYRPYNGSNLYGTPTSQGNENFKSNALAFQANLSPGISYLLNQHFGLELKVQMVNYSKTIDDSRFPEGAKYPSNFETNLSLGNTSFGFNYYF
jgi:hypothetical protein